MAKKKKKRYMVTGSVTISVHTEVVATSARAAEKFARELPMGSVHHDTHQDPVDEEGGSWVEWRTSGDLDGEPSEITVEAMDEEVSE